MSFGERITRGLVAAYVLVVAEAAVALFVGRRALTSVWEVQNGLLGLLPVALPLCGLLGVCGGLLLWLFDDAKRGPKRAIATLFCLGLAFAAAWSVGGGRHLADPAIRGVFAGCVAVLSGGVVFAAAPRLSRAIARYPGGVVVGALGLVINLELVNQRVLVRLYPGFHLSLAVLTCLLAPFASLLLSFARTTRNGSDRPPPSSGKGSERPGAGRNSAGPDASNRSSRVWATWLTPWAVLLVCSGFAPMSARMLAGFDNFRLLLVDGAPILGQVVRAASVLAPPPPIRSSCLNSNDGIDCAGASSSQGKSFSLEGRDLLLVTIDALRADHVGAYGYGRKTTPNIDELAKTGVRFDAAYAPTAHTSYSVTSLMTGKYMRPLLLQGAGQDSDTWATLLQRYGIRTAAFYPPAVFFIDAPRFASFSNSYLGFEYRKVEFLEGPARAEQVASYLGAEGSSARRFVWVHLFAPHEPYEKHTGFDFGDRDIDRYDSEIAYADDAVGRIVREFRQTRPNSVVIVSADHGEEFGDHGGRYHGTTVFEEQVRVPLVVHAAGLFPAHVVKEPVQSIDLLPTILTALDVPKPPRIRGRDLGGLLVGKQPEGKGLALSETEEQLLLAEGQFRLICMRQLGACKLYNLENDPGQTKDVSADFDGPFRAMRERERELSASHGQFEAEGLRAEGRGWPSAILRGVSGDGDAADEIAGLLDDADVAIRRKAAELLFELARPSTRDALALALGRDEDRSVKAWAALALTRLGNGAPLVYDLLSGQDKGFRRLAALALAETGDKRGAAELVDWWRDEKSRNYTRSRELLSALGKIRYRDAVYPLTKSLGDVRLRPSIASALADIGDDAARGPLVFAFAEERYQGARVALAEALMRLGAKEELARPLGRFLGVPDPIPGGLGVALRTGILEHVGGPDSRSLAKLHRSSGQSVTVRVIIPNLGNGTGIRAILRAMNPGETAGEVRIGLPAIASPNAVNAAGQQSGMQKEFLNGVFVSFPIPAESKELELVRLMPAGLPLRKGLSVEIRVLSTSSVRVEAVALVPLSDEIPPPPPEPWQVEQGATKAAEK